MAEPDVVLDALGDPTRRAIVRILADGPRPVNEIAADLPVSRPAVSRHLRLLKAADLVEDEVDGTRRRYSLRADGVEAVRAYFADLWGEAGARFTMMASNSGTRSPGDRS